MRLLHFDHKWFSIFFFFFNYFCNSLNWKLGRLHCCKKLRKCTIRIIFLSLSMFLCLRCISPDTGVVCLVWFALVINHNRCIRNSTGVLFGQWFWRKQLYLRKIMHEIILTYPRTKVLPPNFSSLFHTLHSLLLL